MKKFGLIGGVGPETNALLSTISPGSVLNSDFGKFRAFVL